MKTYGGTREMKKNERLITNKQIEELMRIHKVLVESVELVKARTEGYGDHLDINEAIDSIEKATTDLSLVYLGLVLM